MLTLYGFGESFGVADASPFVLKVDLFLRFTGIKYVFNANANNLQKAPKGKLPFINDDDTVVADSTFILQHLSAKHGIDLDADLSDEQRAVSQLAIKALEEDFYWTVVYTRWVRDDGWAQVKARFFDSMPFGVRHIVPIVARRQVKASCRSQGISRHSHDEITAIADNTLHSMSALLGDKPYFFGDKPHTLDLVAFAFLAQVILVNTQASINDKAKSYDNLVRFCERIDAAYYPAP